MVRCHMGSGPRFIPIGYMGTVAGFSASMLGRLKSGRPGKRFNVIDVPAELETI